MNDTQKRILVVEDELALQSLYQRILEGEGYVVDTATDGKMGLDKMQQQTYDLILLDIMMPEMDGIQVIEKNIEMGNKKNSPASIIMLTNFGQDTLVAKGLSLGIRGYLIKSDYSPDQLLKEIQNNLK